MSNLNYTPMAYAEGIDNENVDSYNKLAQVYGDAEILKHLHKYLTNTDIRLFVQEMWSIPPEINILSNTRWFSIQIVFGGKPYKVTAKIQDKLYNISIYRMTSKGSDAEFLGELTKEDGEAFDHITTLVKQIIKQYL